MKRIFLAASACFLGLFLCAQDTITVQCFDFGDLNKRRAWYEFPPDTASWEKVLMYYTLKCDPSTTWDGYNCGEWDYTTYTNVYDHTGLLDSNIQSHPNFLIQGTTPDTFAYHTNQLYDYYESWQYYTVYDVVSSENDYTVGAGSTPLNHVMQSSLKEGRAQYLYTAAELTGAGLSAGDIHKLRIDVATLGSNLNYFTVKMKNSGLSALSETSYENSGWTTVYEMNTSVGATGVLDLNFTIPFNWNGTSNVVVEFCFDNPTNGTDFQIVGDATGINMGMHNTQDDPYLDFEWGEYIEVPPATFDNIDSNITVSLWVYGDPNTQPLNNYTFEGKNASNQRVINCHLPWSNGRVYWDCGNDGGTYDRIDQAASFGQYAGQWNHWAFTKNVASGQMTIYLNGAIWWAGYTKVFPINDITQFKIAGPADGYGRYDGYIDEFRVWNTDLDATTISDWMYKDIDPSHPYYTNLQLYYPFDEGSGVTVTDMSGYGNHGTMVGLPQWSDDGGCSGETNLNAVMERPNMTFVQGVYTTHLDSVLVLDSVAVAPLTVLEYNDTIIAPMASDTMYVWPEGYAYTYDAMGNAIDSVWYGSTDSLFRNDITYWNIYDEVITYQLQNYVTPYGIGLSLGSSGFRWVYEVTDYHLLLHDSVDISAANTQELIDLKFLFITGTPPRDVMDIEQVWLGDYGHANIVNDVSLPAVNINLDPLGSQYMVRTRTTGHGFGSGENCGEFCPKDHHLKIDGVMEFEWLNWKECADNPVYPQGGTWLYDRAGWCPGTFADTYDHELAGIVTPGATISLDYGMEPYPVGGGEGNYRTSVQLFTYGATNHNVDAALEDIVSPNNWEFHGRVNPICGRPVVLIKNKGADSLTSVDIRYRCQGGYDKVYNWIGSLGFLDTAYVELPVNDPSWWASTTFEASVENPNGTTDEYSNNDFMSAQFSFPPDYPEDFVVWFQTNSAPNETDWYLRDEAGNLIASRTTVTASTIYTDTLHLAPGCYIFEVTDTDEDGLGWWANSDGSGALRFRSATGGSIYKTFGVDFGKFILHHFTVGNVLSTHEYETASHMYLYPNPSDGVFNVDFEFFQGKMLTLEVFNAQGDVVYSEQVQNSYSFFTHELNLGDQEKGVYLFRVSDGTESKVEQIIIN